MKNVKERFLTIIRKYFGYIFLILISCFPLMNDYLIQMEQGHDLFFHLMRIEGIAEGLESGRFPVKIQPGWYDGYGYGCSVFYGDIFLYIPALLRCLGFSLQNAYKFYLVLCNVATVAISGYSFKRIFKSDRLAILGSALYSLSVYRMINVYIRAAVGEHTAMIFLPLIAYAMYCLLGEQKELRKGWILLGLSMAAVLQCHMISAEIFVAVLALVCLVCMKRVWNRNVILAFVKAVPLALGLSLGFLIPFLDYMLTGEFNVNVIGGYRMMQNIQEQGLFFSQLFNIFYRASGSNLPQAAGMSGEMPLGVGAVLGAALMILAYLLIAHKEQFLKTENLKWAYLFGGCSILFLWMSTCYFPWEFLKNNNALFRYMIVNIQFPWRLCSVATLFLVLLWCVVVKMAASVWAEDKIKTGMAVLVFLSLFSASYLLEDALYSGYVIRVYEKEDLDTHVASGEEYLPAYTVSGELKKDEIQVNGDIHWWDYKKEGNTIFITCENKSSESGTIELPLLFYKGYQAEITGEGYMETELAITAGENNVIAVQIPGGSSGTLKVTFREPIYWRIAECVSVLVMLGLILGLYRCNIHSKRSRNQS